MLLRNEHRPRKLWLCIISQKAIVHYNCVMNSLSLQSRPLWCMGEPSHQGDAWLSIKTVLFGLRREGNSSFTWNQSRGRGGGKGSLMWETFIQLNVHFVWSERKELCDLAGHLAIQPDLNENWKTLVFYRSPNSYSKCSWKAHRLEK